MAFLITTTGASGTIIFYDLGERTFTHPTTNYDLETEFTIEEIRNSDDVFSAITGGDLTASYNGVNVTTQSDMDSVRSNDERFSIENELRVKKNPGIGEYSSVKAAVDSITTNSSSNKFRVFVGPGIYVEDTITMKPYVSVQGSGEGATTIQVDSIGKHVIIGSDFSSLSHVTITGASSGFAGIYHSSATGTTLTKFDVSRCQFGTNDTHVLVEAPGVPSAVFLNSCTIGGEGQFNYGFIATNTGTGAGRIVIRNSTTVGMTAPFPTIFAMADGPSTEIVMNSVQIRVPTPGTGTGIKASNGGRLRLLAVNIRGFDTGIFLENVGAATSITASAINFENNTHDLNVEHTGAFGTLDGQIDRTNSFIESSSTVVISGLDRKIIRVAKLDTDYQSVKDAIDSILDASITNRYVISIGPGNFNEDPITLKPYIEIEGSGPNSTYLIANDPSSDFIQGSGNSTIKNLKIGGTTDPGKHLFLYEGDPYAGSFIISNCTLTNSDMILQQRSTNGYSIVFFETCTFDALSYFTTGFDIQDNGIYPCLNGINTFSWLANASFFPSPAVFDDFVKISGSLSKCIASNLYIGTDIGNIGTGSDCFHVFNGATINISGLQIHGFDRAFYIENSGIASTVTITDAQLVNNTTDIHVEHPSTIGSFQGAADMNKVSIDSNSEFNIAIQDLSDGSFNISNRLKVRFSDGTLTDMSTLISKSGTMGIMSGGVLTIAGSPAFQIDISSGFGYLESTVLKRIDWASTFIVLAPNTNNYIFFNSNGILSVDSTIPDTTSSILLGRAVTNSVGIEFIDETPLNGAHYGNLMDDFLRGAIGPVFVSGSIVSEHLDSPALPFHLDVSSGHYHLGTNQFVPSGGNDIYFYSFYRDGSGGFVRTLTNIVDGDFYDDGSGTLQALSSGSYAKHSLYLVGEGLNENYFLVYGQEEFSALALAEQGNIPLPPSTFYEGCVLIASIIVKEGVGNIVEILDLRPIIGFRAPTVSATTFHGNLIGLSNDDHTQYLLVNGSRAMSGNFDGGGNSIININLVDGVDVSAHASRHLPNGTDPLTTATAISVAGSNTEGTANSFSRSDHQHTIASNTVTDAMVSSHTSTKITITAKGQLNSAIAYNDQANTFGDFNQIFRSSRFIITNPANTFNYTFIGSAIAAARNITIPLLTGDDTLVTQAFAQALTNKTGYNGLVITANTGVITTGTWNATAVGATFGGTGQTVYAVGDLLYANTTTTLAKLADVAVGSYLRSGGVGVAPLWSTLTLPNAATKGDIFSASAANTGANLAVGTNGQTLTPNSADATGLRWVTPASYQATPADPATTASTTGVMMGLAGSVTPTKSGTVMIVISGDLDNDTGDDGAQVQMRTGTGTAPTNGAALTGTTHGGLVKMLITASFGSATSRTPFSCNAVITGLTVGTAVWIDISLAAIVGGNARVRDISISAIEI